MGKVPSLHQEGESRSYDQRQNLGPRRTWEQTRSCCTDLLPQPKPSPCQSFTDLLFLCLQGIKAACFDHLFEPHITGAPICKKLNVFLC